MCVPENTLLGVRLTEDEACESGGAENAAAWQMLRMKYARLKVHVVHISEGFLGVIKH